MKKIFTLCSFFLCFYSFGQDGTPDPSFGGGDGILLTSAGGTLTAERTALVKQTDGKILSVFSITDATTGKDFAIIRYNSDGSLDNGVMGVDSDPSDQWGTDGIVKTPIAAGTVDDIPYAIAIQPNGRVLVAGTSNGDFALARYNTDGSLDASFSSDGIATADISTTDRAYAVALQSDNKIIIAGTANNDFAILRFNTDGSLDAGFDGPTGAGNGKITIDFPGSGPDIAYTIAVQSDGRILVGGEALSDFGVVRLNTDGTLDTGFDGDTGSENGIIRTPVSSSGSDYLYSLRIQPDGKILAMGRSDAGGPPGAGVVRYLTDGKLDTGFDTDGKLSFTISPAIFITDGAVQTDGKILLSGYSFGSGQNLLLIRLNSNGSMDATSFGTSGVTTVDLNAGSSDVSFGGLVSQGDDLVMSGFISAANQLALVKFSNSSPIYTAPIILPLTLTSFQAQLSEQSVNLRWATSVEENTAYFEVERSTDSKNFSKIGTVPAAGNSSTTKVYDLKDQNPSSVNYYRLKMVDIDGEYTYSKVVKIKKTPALNILSVYPNPAKDILHLQLSTKDQTTAMVALLDRAGQQLMIKTIKGSSSTLLISTLQPGTYFIRAITTEGSQLIKFIKE